MKDGGSASILPMDFAHRRGGVMIISRDELIRILGSEIVTQAENLPEEAFDEQKWDNLSALLGANEKLAHTPLLEARRSYLKGLSPNLQILLVRHLFEQEKMKSV